MDELHHLLFQAVGLGYGRPAAGLMEREPCQPDQPILTRPLFVWLISVGLITGVGTLGVISWAEQAHTQAIAHTMGVVTFSLYALLFSIETRDERRTGSASIRSPTPSSSSPPAYRS